LALPAASHAALCARAGPVRGGSRIDQYNFSTLVSSLTLGSLGAAHRALCPGACSSRAWLAAVDGPLGDGASDGFGRLLLAAGATVIWVDLGLAASALVELAQWGVVTRLEGADSCSA
jgi:hypothetical protein